MEEYYYSSADRKPKNKSLAMKIIDMIVLVVSFLTFVVMALTLVTSYYDPSASWIFPVLGLISPAVYLFATLLMLYWVIRWRLLWAGMLLLPLLVGMPSISHYGKIETKKHYGAPSRRGTITLLNYNTRGFVNDNKKVAVDDVVEMLEELRPDIICLQEYDKKRFSESEEPQFMRGYDRRIVSGQATYSRYKILGSSDELIDSSFKSGGGFWSDLLIGSDTVRVYNLHLHSTAITAGDDSYLSNMEFISDSLKEDKLRGMISRFRTSSIGRAAQADTIAHNIDQSPHKVIVCGDFNDTPNSYVFRKISHGLQDSFQEAGVGYAYTYRGFMKLLRIDYILVEEPIEILNYQTVDSLSVSDHLPIVTTLKL